MRNFIILCFLLPPAVAINIISWSAFGPPFSWVVMVPLTVVIALGRWYIGIVEIQAHNSPCYRLVKKITQIKVKLSPSAFYNVVKFRLGEYVFVSTAIEQPAHEVIVVMAAGFDEEYVAIFNGFYKDQRLRHKIHTIRFKSSAIVLFRNQLYFATKIC